MLPKNLNPAKCIKFVQKRGCVFVNREGSHITFMNKVNGKDNLFQIIDNSNPMYPPNAKVMIKKSGIPEEEWLKNCK